MHVDDIIVVGMFSSTNVDAYDIYQEAISIVREKYTLLYTTDDAIRKK